MARAKKKVTCQDCDRTFSRKGELQQHRREEHSRRNMCHICKRAFESEKRLKMHSQFHNVDGEYKCFYCPKRFNKAWKMKIHLVNHSGRPSYLCEFCGDDFLYPGKIVAHLKRMHDVCYACKDCGQAIPIEYNQRPHKCKIYGCKDCLLSFASEVELAIHVKIHGETHVVEVDSAPPSPPQGIESQCEGYLGVQESHDQSQDASPVSGDGEGEDRDPLDPAVVAAEETGVKALRSSRLVREEQRGSGAPCHVSHVSSLGVQSNKSSERGSPSPSAREGPCDAGPRYMEADERLSRDVLVSPSPPSTPVRCSVPNYSDGGRVNTNYLTPLLHGHRVPVSTSVIKSEEEDEEEEEDREEEEEEEEEETQPPSYISSVLLRSPSSALRSRFKVPEASTGLWKKLETPATKSLRRKQDELDKAVQKRDLLNTLQLYMDTDARLTQCNQTSFESWLTSDSFSSPEHDYVFGFEASVSVGSHREDPHYHYFNKKIPKKEKVDMTFEDLCLF